MPRWSPAPGGARPGRFRRGWPAAESLAGSHGLTEPQQVNQQLDGISRAVTADADDALRIGEHLRHRTAPIQDARITAHEYLQLPAPSALRQRTRCASPWAL